MKKKLILFMVLSMLALQACTFKVWQFQHMDFTNNRPVYKLVASGQIGSAAPVINYILPARQMTKR